MAATADTRMAFVTHACHSCQRGMWLRYTVQWECSSRMQDSFTSTAFVCLANSSRKAWAWMLVPGHPHGLAFGGTMPLPGMHGSTPNRCFSLVASGPSKAAISRNNSSTYSGYQGERQGRRRPAPARGHRDTMARRAPTPPPAHPAPACPASTPPVCPCVSSGTPLSCAAPRPIFSLQFPGHCRQAQSGACAWSFT